MFLIHLKVTEEQRGLFPVPVLFVWGGCCRNTAVVTKQRSLCAVR